MATPRELAEERLKLSADYFKMSEALGGLLTKKTVKWSELRANTKSDKQADMQWDATDEGREEMRLRLMLKATEKQMSAIKTMLEVMQGEARNQF